MVKLIQKKTRGSEFSDDKNKKLKDLVEKIKKETKENKNKKFVYTTTSNVQYDFNKYRDLILFGNEIYTKNLSLDEAKDEQKEMSDLIDELEKKINVNRTGPKLKNKNKKAIEEVIKNPKQLYKTRNNIINAFGGTEEKELNFDWLHRPKGELEELIKKIGSDDDFKLDSTKKTMQKDLKHFLNYIMTGKIDNIKDAKKEYLERIMDYKIALKKQKSA